jgi:hypothetical protein
MALVAEYNQIKGFRSRCYKKVGEGYQLKPITKTLVFATMYIHMDSITKENWKDFYHRIAAWEKVFGPSASILDRRRKSRWREHRITPEDVRNHIGLAVNVVPKSDAYFYKRLVTMLRREVEYATL